MGNSSGTLTPGSSSSPGGVTGGQGGSSSPGSGGSPSPTPSPSTSSGGSPSPTPGTPGSGSPSPLQPGQPVPYERFSEVNTRAQALAWADGLDPDQVSEANRLYNWFDTDPVGAHNYITDLLTRQGHLRPAAPAPQQGRGGQSHLVDPSTGEPQADIIIPASAENGWQEQRLYSARQQQAWGKWLTQQHDERLNTLEGRTVQQETQTEARRMVQEAEANWPYFKDFAKEVFAELRKDKRLNLEGAYRRVVVQSGRMKAKEREALMAEMRTNANAGQGVTNPGQGTPGSTAELRKLPLKELLKREAQRRGIGS